MVERGRRLTGFNTVKKRLSNLEHLNCIGDLPLFNFFWQHNLWVCTEFSKQSEFSDHNWNSNSVEWFLTLSVGWGARGWVGVILSSSFNPCLFSSYAGKPHFAVFCISVKLFWIVDDFFPSSKVKLFGVKGAQAWDIRLRGFYVKQTCMVRWLRS